MADETEAPAADTAAPADAAPAAPAAAIARAATPAYSIPPDEALRTAPAAVVEGKDWKKGAIVVARGSIPTSGAKPVIVVETRDLPTFKDDGTIDKEAKVHLTGYPTKGDLYFRTESEVKFPEKAEVITLGEDIEQGGTWGFSPHPGYVHVGPAHPVYAAANLAFTRGATDIDIVGLTDEEKAKLQPWFDALENHPAAPANVNITLK